MTVTSPLKPRSAREPYCVHTYRDEPEQPASTCTTCMHSPELQQWRDGWDAWLAANPDSDEAREIAEWRARASRPSAG